MTALLFPVSTCIFLYVFYSLLLKQALDLQRFLIAALLACLLVGVIGWLALSQ